MFKYLFKIYKIKALLKLHEFHLQRAESWLMVQRGETELEDKLICYNHSQEHIAAMTKIENQIKLM